MVEIDNYVDRQKGGVVLWSISGVNIGYNVRLEWDEKIYAIKKRGREWAHHGEMEK